MLEGGRRFKEAISLASECAREATCPRIHVLIGKQQSGLRDKLRQGAVARLRWAASDLASHGIDLMPEPLNPHDQSATRLVAESWTPPERIVPRSRAGGLSGGVPVRPMIDMCCGKSMLMPGAH